IILSKIATATSLFTKVHTPNFFLFYRNHSFTLFSNLITELYEFLVVTIALYTFFFFLFKSRQSHHFHLLKNEHKKRTNPIGSVLILLHYQYNTLFNEISSKKVPN